MRLPPRWILFLVVFVEGFAVLAAEILAIRQIIPYTGSGTDTVSIIIAAVLLPLAIGNFMGGRFTPKPTGAPHVRSVRHKLLANVIIAMGFLVAGLSYPVILTFFSTLLSMDITGRHLLNAIYSAAFIVVPIYLLGQTLPLVSHYFSREELQRTTGKMLFASTTGSFMGSVFCTLVLMAFIGVHYTVVIVIAMLGSLTIILTKKSMPQPVIAAGVITLVALALNNGWVMKSQHVVANNEYHMVQIIEDANDPDTSTLLLNGNFSARNTTNEVMRFRYDRYIDAVFLAPLRSLGGPKKDILIIGAGGFILGRQDPYNNITYIDIDEDLLKISEELFLKEKLTPNKTFVPQPARAFLTKAIQDGKQYDMIILDIFQGKTTIPEHLVTQEFYRQVFSALKDGGIMAGNFISSPNYADAFSIKLDNTLRSVFGNLNRQILAPYSAWEADPTQYRNMIYSGYKRKVPTEAVYTDDKNPNFHDKFKKVE